MPSIFRRSALALAATCALAAGSAAAVSHSLDIRTPHNDSTIAYDINANGQVAAVLEDSEGVQRGVLFHRGVLTELGSLGGKFSNTKAINDNGEIVGSAQEKDGHWRAFVYTMRDGMRDLGTLGGPSSYGMAINAAGQTAGMADTAEGDFHAYFSSEGKMHDIGTLGGKVSYASGLNMSGQVVGTAMTADNYRHAFVYDRDNGMRDLGTLGGRQSSATAINDDGVIVGASETADRKWHAFVIEHGKMIDLGAKIGVGNSYATAINNAGHVVGTVVMGDERHSFVWRDGVMTVHSGGYGLYMTNAINDSEQVIGATKGQRLHAAVMGSKDRAVKADDGIFELGQIVVLLALGAVGLVVHRRRYEGLMLRSFA
jgi:probable HAF family extracellular repeat protein